MIIHTFSIMVGPMMKTFNVKTITTLVLSVFLALSISACREAEQDRIKLYEKGVYLGKKDTPLLEEQKRTLANHTMRQSAW
jgi:hypothetical protein